jgi:S1-C subfamily serine protease
MLERIKEYEAAREKYPDFPSFAGRLFDMLDDLEPVLSGGPPADLGLADVWLTDDGVPIKMITPGSLAAKAGMKAGDTVQSIAGIRINGSESYLKAWHKWEAAQDGEVVPFRIKRGKNSSLISVTMKRAGGFRGFRKKAGR